MKFVPRPLKGPLRRAQKTLGKPLGALQRSIENVVTTNRALSGVYSAVDGRFGYEAQRVLAGQRMHHEDTQQADGARYTLRRNTHRLEKGLCMRPRRPVFALDYIVETVTALERTKRSQCSTDADLFQWACDVLQAYFDACASHPVIDRERARFREITAGLPWQAGASVPYQRPDPENLPSYEQLAALAKRRRSVRWFLPKPVPRELVDKALLVAFQAPSACNRQPFRYAVLDDPELVQKVAKIPMGTAGYGHNIPTLVVVLGQLRAFRHERDRHLPYIDGCLAAMGFELALETLGLSSCSINWPAIPEKEHAMERALGLAPDECPIMLIAVGYPDPEGLVPYSQKRPLDELRTWNR